MKQRYFGYYLRKLDSQEKFLFNLKPFVDAFVGSSNMELKSSFKRGDDKLYFTHITGQQHLYYFIRTSDDGFIKRINEQNQMVSDIAENLSEGEKIAYASYVYLSATDCIMACASSTSCPRFDNFAEYINELFKKIGLDNYEFHIDALTSNSDKIDLMKMEMVNSVYVDVAADKSLGRLIAKTLTGEETTNLGNFRIIIEPTGLNMKQTFVSMLNRFAPSSKIQNSDGVIRIGAKAKHNELKGQLTDYWLDNENNLTDSLNPRTKTKLPDQITAKYDENKYLKTQYDRYVKNQNLNTKADTELSKFADKASFSKNENGQVNINKVQIPDNDDSVVIPLNREASC